MAIERPIDAEEKPSVAVVVALAEAKDQSPLEMDALSETIDPDALDTLIEAGGDDDVTVGFDYDGSQVTVEPTTVHVEE